jgi:hypothetical protein
MYYRTAHLTFSDCHLLHRKGHTFSIPKNLSLPSSRIGPALSRSFSSGVWGWEVVSFLDGDEPIDGLVEPC